MAGDLALPRGPLEVSNFNGLRKSLGLERPIEFQDVSTSTPKALRQGTARNDRGLTGAIRTRRPVRICRAIDSSFLKENWNYK